MYLINHYKRLGAKGVGEITANMPVDDPLLENLFYHCEACDMPVTIHLAPMNMKYGTYGIMDDLGLPRLEKILEKYPNAIALCGHAHRNATDEYNLWQGAFTAILVPSSNYNITRPGYENGYQRPDKKTIVSPLCNIRRSWQGLVGTLYSNRFVISLSGTNIFAKSSAFFFTLFSIISSVVLP